MSNKLDWNYKEIKDNATEEVDFINVETKPYVCKILNINDVDEKRYLKISFDIAQGDLKDYFRDQNIKFGGDWSSQATIYRSYKESAKYFFAAFITAVEKSNDNFKFNPDANWKEQLEGKLFVVNYGLQEYISDDIDANGKYIVKTAIKPLEIRSTQALKENKIQPLKLKVLSENDFEYKALKENEVTRTPSENTQEDNEDHPF